ncbi:hypothetical protein [Weizmannia acidilactici]|nr:hypothetical protein [Weizmannia acidilactici]
MLSAATLSRCRALNLREGLQNLAPRFDEAAVPDYGKYTDPGSLGH